MSYKKIVSYRVPSTNNENGKFIHVILTEPNNPKTYASVIILNNWYRKLEAETYMEKYNLILEPEYKELSNYDILKVIRRKIQRKFLEKQSKLNCVYCQKPLKLSNGKKNSFTATVDHYIPINSGYDPFEETNFRVCCEKCNSKKGG